MQRDGENQIPGVICEAFQGLGEPIPQRPGQGAKAPVLEVLENIPETAVVCAETTGLLKPEDSAAAASAEPCPVQRNRIA
jgi:hypothetical protein